jgi:hypothetical protein
MNKVFLSLFAIALLASCNNETKQAETANETVSIDGATSASASPVTDPANAAAFKFEKDSYDFGQINEGEKVSYSFAFVNVGKVPMIINSATATCGCTVPDYPREPIAPNAEGKIDVVFDSKGKPGMQNKVITLTANTIPGTTELHLIGDVKAAANN